MNKTMRTLISGTFWLTAATLLAGAPVALGNALLLGGGPADAAVKALGVYEIAGTTADLQIDTKRLHRRIGRSPAKAGFHAQLGDRDSALDWLERAISDRDPEVPFVHARPEFAGLHDDERFQALLGRIKYTP